MKKTLIALAALTGLASAAEWPITLSSYFTDNQGQQQATVDAVYGLNKDEANALGGLTADFLNGISTDTVFTVQTGDLLTSSGVTTETSVKVSSITLSSSIGQYYVGPDRRLNVVVNGTTYTSDGQATEGYEGTHYGKLIFTFSGDNAFTFNVGDTLNVTFPAVKDVLHTAYGVFKGQTGVSNLTSPTNFTAWQAAVKIEGTATPEPATATLSLLALAGLAARRRRH